MDPFQNDFIPVPKYIEKSGLYYVKAVNSVGCNEIKPLIVALKNAPDLIITNPPAACYPATVDITSALVTAGSENGLTFKYWYDADTTKPLFKPKSIDTAGTYFIKATSKLGCFNVQPVKVVIASFNTNPAKACEKVDLTQPSVLLNVTEKFNFSYWKDSAAAVSIAKPETVTSSGIYFIKGSLTASNCEIIKPVAVTVLPLPTVNFIKPEIIVYPETYDLSRYLTGPAGNSYGYWKDMAATKPVLNPYNVDSSGMYYLTAVNAVGCMVNYEVKLQIDPPPIPEIQAPNIFSPNNDGIHDKFTLIIDGVTEVKQLEIFNR